MAAGQSQVGRHTAQFRLASLDSSRRYLDLETTEADCVLQSVREAAAAIPAMTGRDQLICEELHWRYCRGRGYRPQLAKMAHGMAGGGSRDDFKNPEFVQKWSCFIFYVLNMDPQVSWIQVQQVLFVYTSSYKQISLSTLCTWNPTTSWYIMRSALQVSEA
jgi:hypothetical protein